MQIALSSCVNPAAAASGSSPALVRMVVIRRPIQVVVRAHAIKAVQVAAVLERVLVQLRDNGARKLTGCCCAASLTCRGHGRRHLPEHAGAAPSGGRDPAVPLGPWMLFTSSHQFHTGIVRDGRCGSPRGAAGPAAAWRCRCGWPRLRLAPRARSAAATPPPAALQHAVKTSGAALSLGSDTVDILPIQGGPICSHEARLLLSKPQKQDS